MWKAYRTVMSSPEIIPDPPASFEEFPYDNFLKIPPFVPPSLLSTGNSNAASEEHQGLVEIIPIKNRSIRRRLLEKLQRKRTTK